MTNRCTIVMYHYVRELRRSRYPGIKGLSTEKFRGQLDYLARLKEASDRGRWVCAADKLHNANSILADLARTIEPELIWDRFKAGKEGTVWWYRAVYLRLEELGFDAPIMPELERTVKAVEKAGGAKGAKATKVSAKR